MRNARLTELTNRWRARHDARHQGEHPSERPPADPEREALAARAFPFREMTAEAYVKTHGAEMVGFTYDDERYADPALDVWLQEVGRLLRQAR